MQGIFSVFFFLHQLLPPLDANTNFLTRVFGEMSLMEWKCNTLIGAEAKANAVAYSESSKHLATKFGFSFLQDEASFLFSLKNALASEVNGVGCIK